MRPSDVVPAVAASVSLASALGLQVSDAEVLHESNRIVVRLLPCDVLARVAASAEWAGKALEVEVARQLAATDSPVAVPDPRVEARAYVRDGFTVTFWRYYEPSEPGEVAPAAYAGALGRLHAGLRRVDVVAPHFTDRVSEAQRLVSDPAQTPALADADRSLLGDALRLLGHAVAGRGADEQLLHGEPHPGNLLRTSSGLRFVDFETCCRGPIEFDIAHAPRGVEACYPGADQGLVRDCRLLVLAMIATWRWEWNDRLPNGRELGAEWLSQLRAELAGPGTEGSP